ncbi:MAG: aldolase/citrate lyase family protein [Pseudomonadota bacterium]
MNTLKDKWAAGQATVNGWMSIGSSFAAEIMAGAGYDSLTIDMQHGFLDYSHAMGMFQAMRASGVVPMARVPWLDNGAIMKALDAGALGIICPMINLGEEAEALVRAMRYPPLGSRSFGPTRANYHHGPDYYTNANASILAIAMIETGEAVERLDEIITTPGLDGIYIGPSDLSLGVSQGNLPPGLDRQEPEMQAVIKDVLSRAKAQGLRAGIHCMTPAYAAQTVGWGFDFATINGDVRLLAAAASDTVDETRKLLGQAATGSGPAKGGY